MLPVAVLPVAVLPVAVLPVAVLPIAVLPVAVLPIAVLPIAVLPIAVLPGKKKSPRRLKRGEIFPYYIGINSKYVATKNEIIIISIITSNRLFSMGDF